MNSSTIIKSVLACLLLVLGLNGQASAQLKMEGLALNAGAGSAEPNLSKGPQGNIILSWQEPLGDVTHLRYSRLENSGWSKPTTVAQGNNWFVNWADFPSVLQVSDNLWAAHWLRKRPGGIYAYDVALALSVDGGKTWGDSMTPHRDNTATEHGFVSLYPATSGVGVVWLDGRNTSPAGSEHAHSEETSDGGMTLRHAVVAADGTLSEEAELDNLVCDCCQTSVAITSDGPLVVYRNRSEEEIRDIYITRYSNGKWQTGQPVSNDGWKISGCPVNGPAVVAQGNIVAVAWFTMADEKPRVRFARSKDGGRSFSKAFDIDDSEPSGRVDLALLGNGNAAISWLAKGENGLGNIRVQIMHPDGTISAVHSVATTKLNRPSGFPQMMSDGNSLVFAWTDGQKKESQVKSLRFILP